MTDKIRPQKVVVVGAGPVGALAALYSASRGDHVEVYEFRGDPRDASTVPLNFTKSINLALSERGINSMKWAGNGKRLIEAVLGETIPMHGRMIHGRNKLGDLQQASQAYDVHGRSIHAVDRAGLNKRLLDTLEIMSNVKLFFNHKLTGADFKKKTAWFERRMEEPAGEDRRAPEIEVNFDFLIGADGAHSATRYHLMKFARVSYQQEYIDTQWCEFQIQPLNSDFAISPHHLHIWPGTHFMFIAIPSLDKSFTCTMFAPQATFETLSEDPASLVFDFFASSFPGVSPELISEEDLVAQFSRNPHLPLITIKTSPYHYKSSAVIVGDAAHAMVPFYGQGMNAGLEDVRVLFEVLDKHGVYDAALAQSTSRESLREDALSRYTGQRTPDAFAINDLALQNYYEMRAGVTSRTYLYRKWAEETLSKYFPSLGWHTQYSRISFGNQRYSEVVKRTRRQGQILLLATLVFGLGTSGIGFLLVKRLIAKIRLGRAISR